MPESLVIKPLEYFAQAVAKAITSEILSAQTERGHVSLALSGGETPRNVYRSISRLQDCQEICWSRVRFYFGDERLVEPIDPRSNYRLAKESLFDNLPISSDQVRRIPGETNDPEQAAALYEALLPERFDVLLLGMGEDGHTASIFPGSAVAAEKERRVAMVKDAPKPPKGRITITPPVIKKARKTIMMVAGKNKADALSRVLEGSYNHSELPAQLAIAGTWFADTEASLALKGIKK